MHVQVPRFAIQQIFLLDNEMQIQKTKKNVLTRAPISTQKSTEIFADVHTYVISLYDQSPTQVGDEISDVK